MSDEKMTFRQKVSRIQMEMKSPKNLYNSFGKYKYRNAEGILESFKPYEGKYGVYLTISDEIKDVSGRYYVEAKATLNDVESDASISVTALAREPENKRGMDEPQITGTASSYARKYALNGLLLLDDTKDPDSDEYYMQTGRSGQQENVGKYQADAGRIQTKKNTIEAICQKHKITPEQICKSNGITWDTATEDQMIAIIRAFKAKGWT